MTCRFLCDRAGPRVRMTGHMRRKRLAKRIVVFLDYSDRFSTRGCASTSIRCSPARTIREHWLKHLSGRKRPRSRSKKPNRFRAVVSFGAKSGGFGSFRQIKREERDRAGGGDVTV